MSRLALNVITHSHDHCSSTWPISRLGAATAHGNRVVHGRMEDRSDFGGLLEGLMDHYEPVGELEDFIVQKLAFSLWKEVRGARQEAEQVSQHTGNLPRSGVLSNFVQ